MPGSSGKVFRIGCPAPGRALARCTADAAVALADRLYGGRVELVFPEQCFASCGHFAGDDRTRANAVVDLANDPAIDAIWFARGGYGACRIAEDVIARLSPSALAKPWLGYSDAGFILAALQRAGARKAAHGPMPVDLVREDGDRAAARGLAWLLDGDPGALEGGLDEGRPALAFNLTVLSQLLGTPIEPDFAGRVLLVEDVGEYMYRIDRYFFHVTANANVRRCAGLRLGRCSAVPKNDPDFGQTEEQVARYWCQRSGVPFLGCADIGHDVDNRVVPFG
ncbi:MAG: LD-carboxypeptidase [Hyphomonadaceae bacterium]